MNLLVSIHLNFVIAYVIYILFQQEDGELVHLPRMEDGELVHLQRIEDGELAHLQRMVAGEPPQLRGMILSSRVLAVTVTRRDILQMIVIH